ncbi:hypothetical protein [Ruegeria halocynthiae]|uniref:hypothetical protein n=1 Tax=Ruegeria halocynthiae TaxID=985054 RepID=UPI00055DC561|nr:hypothetical protein [Ruegeria halocynthiae]
MQVAIHAGAAFTDEGSLLKSLQKNSEVLTQEGIAVIGPRRYRQVFKPAFDTLGVEPADRGLLHQMQNMLPVNPDVRRTIFSSDNFVGERALALQEGQLYPQAGRRMALLDTAYSDHQITLFLGLSNPGSFIPKLLMTLPQADRESIIRSTDLSCLSWIGMIEDIRDLAPDVQITLWSNEDTPLIWGDIVRAMGDLNDDVALNDEYDLLLSLLDDTGKSKVLGQMDSVDGQDKATVRESLAQIFEDHAKLDTVEEELELPGWSAEIIDAFSELYEQDLTKLETMPGVRILKP